jgi:hypothetical protein
LLKKNNPVTAASISPYLLMFARIKVTTIATDLNSPDHRRAAARPDPVSGGGRDTLGQSGQLPSAQHDLVCSIEHGKQARQNPPGGGAGQ